MPGFLLTVASQVLCSHAGQAKPTAPNPRVLAGGQPTVLMTAPYIVASCTLPPPPIANGPCVTAQWVSGTTRVLSNGQPLLVQSSQAICAPSGTPLLIVATQPRVSAF